MNPDFDRIRPFHPEELPAAYERLLSDPQFSDILKRFFKDIPFDTLAAKMRACKTSLDFQIAFCYPFLKDLLSQTSTGYDINVDNVDLSHRYTFVSNHRDIVLDSAFLEVLLFETGCETTCELAVGDNLLAAEWIKDLVRVNKSFFVERSAGFREMLTNSKRLGEYIHYVINEKNDNVWIAQREGRAKDSDDRTQPSILKMMAMGGEGSVIDRLKQLHIVPLAISYEYDPCDYLKAAEFQLKRDVEGWRKTMADDVMSMKTGILGYKGEIHYHCATCIDDFLDTLPEDMPKGDIYDAVAHEMDRRIHLGYRIYAVNHIAADLLEELSTATPCTRHKEHYTDEERARFEEYVASRLALIDIPNKDEAFLRERILTMYANPAINQMQAQRQVDNNGNN